MDREDSDFVAKESCPECGSRDNLARYSDGHAFCFGCEHWEPPTDKPEASAPRRRTMSDFEFIQGKVMGLPQIALSEETCRKTGISIVQYGVKGEDGERLPRQSCLAFEYRRANGSPFGQKVRYALEGADKTFAFPSAGGQMPLWLMHLWGPGCDTRELVIVEGEKDAASFLQVTGGIRPVVSVPNGAAAAAKALKAHYEWLDRFDRIVIMFDADKAGREGAREAAAALPAGKAWIVEVRGFKDANEALKDGSEKAIKALQWAPKNAEIYKPDGILLSHEFVSGVRKRRLLQEASKITYPWEGITTVTRGIFEGDLVVLMSGSGCGKSTIARHIAHHVHMSHGLPVGMLMLEEDKDDTIDGLLGIQMGRNILMDPNLCTDTEHEEAIKAMGFDTSEGAVAIYDHFGSTDVDNICSRISFMARALGRKLVVLDHISIMVSGNESTDERKAIDVAMTKLKTVAQAEKIRIIAVCHLTRPKGDKGHEDGAEVRAGQARGSHAIIQLANVVLGVQKDPDDPTSDVVDVYVLKNRKSGQRTFAARLRFNRETGILTQIAGPEDTTVSSVGFQDHTLVESTTTPPATERPQVPADGGLMV